jgi:phosphatidylserine/phosphatidylglycerophosphate/cardiolipin synthase-like enzyme
LPPSRESAYPALEADLKQSLRRLKALPAIADSLSAMPEFLDEDFHFGEVRLAHEFANLIDKRVVRDAVTNMQDNPNSIMYIMGLTRDSREKHIKVVSPYLFAARYLDSEGNVLLDEAEEIKAWLAEDEERTYEIITNSVLTSDNFLAQAMVDMDMAPRLLLDEVHLERWQGPRSDGEANPELIDSAAWRELVSNPRLRVYETGRGDDRLLGGDADYGKLHAKYIITDRVGFLGTANFDYRSRLFNNEMGFFFRSESLTADFLEDFDLLRARSYRWGSPEWLAMRAALVAAGGSKGTTTKNQRNLYKMMKTTGLSWLF